ncbi:DNA-directed RNA polymerase subunit A' [Candidatus Pacearchaeota archaeon CG10_big_fil_rev_8_21_14_0_10_34_76]|nr:MAG: DNA-directed RNA polymerase subunit A' [Candidatus Pacearchaeota archaeon CG10_big_fil_rev_8_21_14_0_10_34_76]
MEDIIRKKVKALRFNLISPETIKKISVAKIVTPELYDVDGFPVDGGLMDLRLGAIDPGVRCRTDGATMKDCPGYPGTIELARPILHIKYVPLIELFLRSFCQNCSKLTLDEHKQADLTPVERAKKARDKKKCPHCGEPQEKVKLEKPITFMMGKRRIFPTEIREMLVKIKDEEMRRIGVNSKTCRPEWAILSQLIVPSVNVRPSITLESGERSEDDLTHKLSDIIRANQRLWENLNAGAPEVIIEDLWDLLQYHVTTYFDNNTTRIPPARHRSGQPLKTITERIKGKEGRIRKNLAGKRVNFSGRTVVSPDPYLKLNEVGVPYDVATIITVAENVTTANIERMKNLIRQGSEHPGANYVMRPDGKKKKITNELKEELCNEIQPGYKIERHLQDGDVVLFNRHPSLHKQSLMAHYVRVLPHRTFRIHPASAFPYNADFDGDEVNIHSPQTEEARAEAIKLLDLNHNIISGKNGINLIGCIADAVTGLYMLGREDFSKAYAQQLLYSTGIVSNLKKKTVSGKEIFEEILPKDANIKIPNELTGEKTFGVEEGVMVKEIDKACGRQEAINSITRAFTLGTTHLSRSGYTLSIQDVNVSSKVKEITKEIIEKAEKKTQQIIEDAKSGTLALIPGKSVDESKELKISQALNEVRSEVGKVVKANFPAEGNVSKMITSGAAGSLLNITQIGCCVGQQILWNKRIGFGYSGRTLSFFQKGDIGADARGFIKSSYSDGLNPKEFFFGAITARDGLMDTALRTPKSGYLYRRLVSALQDLRAEYDGTVRDASGNIIQFLYGGDGEDVAGLHLNKKVSPGESVGVITAQSFGEASTQMVLNVFHSAGVAEMQVTLGLPRLIEIFDARKKPSTPLMELYLDKDSNNEKDARVIAEKIKEVKLKEIAKEISMDFSGKKLEIEIDSNALKAVHVGIQKIADRLIEKGFVVKVKDNNLLIVNLGELNFREMYKIKEKMKDTIISGLKNISQVVVAKRDSDYVILTAGSNLSEVMEIKGIDRNRVSSNDIHETAAVLGIEAARETIMNEIKKVIESQGLDINIRHLDLIADAMTSLGVVKGVTRMGIVSEKTSVFARAAFETPDKEFVNATIQGKKDDLASVIENIMLNQPVPIGTGLPGLLVKVTGPLVKKK